MKRASDHGESMREMSILTMKKRQYIKCMVIANVFLNGSGYIVALAYRKFIYTTNYQVLVTSNN